MADLFPRDIWLSILNLMDVKSLLAMRATCTRLNGLVIGMQERWFREYHWLCRKHWNREQMRKIGKLTSGQPIKRVEDIPIDSTLFKPKLQHYIYNYLIESEHYTRARTAKIDAKIKSCERTLALTTTQLKRLRDRRETMVVPPIDNNIFKGCAVNNYKKPKKAAPKKNLKE
jgi:hypothetical protein